MVPAPGVPEKRREGQRYKLIDNGYEISSGQEEYGIPTRCQHQYDPGIFDCFLIQTS